MTRFFKKKFSSRSKFYFHYYFPFSNAIFFEYDHEKFFKLRKKEKRILEKLNSDENQRKMLKRILLIRNEQLLKRSKIRMISGKVRLGVCQLNSDENKEKNLLIGEQLIEKGKQNQAQMIFFPEAFDFICPSKQLTIQSAEDLHGNIIKSYQYLAKKHQLWLSLGGFHQKINDEDKLLNSHLIINDQGDIVAQYSKIHLFDVQSGQIKYLESEYTKFGQEILSPVSTPVGRIALSICYDLRFPEMARLLTMDKYFGAQILTYPSAFTKSTGEAHWEILLRARAIENQCFVVAAAQTGFHGSSTRESYGHSLVVDPWGKILLDMKTNCPSIETIEIDLNLINEIKERMPINEHRRFDLYQLKFNSSSLRSIFMNLVFEKGKEILFLVPINNEDQFIQWGQIKISEKQIFYRTRLTFAIVNRKPVVQGHVLISPNRCVQRFSELTKEELEDLFNSTQKISIELEKFYQVQSLTISIQDGIYAGQTIRHVHVHLLPRRQSDFQDNDSIYQHLANHDRDEHRWRTIEDMAKEAKILRTLFYHELTK